MLIAALAAFKVSTPRSHASSQRQSLSFEDRVAAQRAIEAVYHHHRIWPKDNPQPKPALDEVLPEAALRAKIADYLRQSRALELWRGRAITADELQAELERMARQTRAAAVLDELWAALGRDPFVIAECLARPLLAERELRQWYEKDEGGRMKDETRAQSLHPFDEWWSGVREAMGVEVDAPEFAYWLPEIAVAVPCGSDVWTATNTTGAPSPRAAHTAIWTGSEMIVWGGVADNRLNIGGRYNPATDSWTAVSTTGAPSPRYNHTAVWTGKEMIIWGGLDSVTVNTGGRYNPVTDLWTATNVSGAPSPRGFIRTAIWTGSEMIVWGGTDFSLNYFNTGGRYNPTTDTWRATSESGAPSKRAQNSAVWTGSEMIVWGGAANNGVIFNTGGRYNPVTDSWVDITTSGAPSARDDPTSVWTGSEMIVWGSDGKSQVNTGGRYKPATDSWIAISTIGAPSVRNLLNNAVWTGSEMIIWGASDGGGPNTGGRYSPTMDTWTAITTTGAPSARRLHSSIWTGNEMIVWGGQDNSPLNTGGRYSFAPPLDISPTSQSFTANGGTGNIAITAQGGCTWTATSNDSFIIIASGRSGAGNGTVAFSVAANTTGSPRRGTLTIGTQPFAVMQSGENPLPTLSGLNPASALAGSATFTLTVTGAGLVNGATVRWNGANRTTAFVSNTQLTAQIPASDLLTLGPATVTVFNPTPGGGVSNALSFNVTASIASVSAASFRGAELAVNLIAAAFGSELAAQTLTAPVMPLPTTLAGTTVRVRDSAGIERLAPLFFVSPTQVNYLVLAGTTTGAAIVTITSGNGKLSLGTVQIVGVAPGLFAANANGQGVAAAVAMRLRGDGSRSFEPVAQFDATAGRFVALPIDLGPITDQVFLMLFGTGFRAASSLNNVEARIGGASAEALFAGAQGDLAGLDQSNVRVPRSLAGRGEVDVVLTVDGKAANTVRVNIK